MLRIICKRCGSFRFQIFFKGSQIICDSRRYFSKWLKEYKERFLERRHNPFCENSIQRILERDKLNKVDWKLIYYDVSSSHVSDLFAFFTSFLLIFLAYSSYEHYNYIRGLSFRHSNFQRLLDDAEELGVFIVLPLSIFALIVPVMIRSQNRRILRIYQYIKNPEQFTIYFKRGAIKLLWEPTKDLTQHVSSTGILRHFVGNVSINGKYFLLDHNSFRANNYYSYMLGYTKVPPP
ncbi:unnamed protein product [Dracunculus medinensis]|uniref:Transmembrane protein n=1 Tax=Dracunculus medinensis TaxID=318479 RepID=A0A158Q2H9_DRAME|nr:unnamed protein product [Dracunculus medinensis]